MTRKPGWILKWVDRLPVIVYIGAGVLAWTAAQMMLREPLLAPYVDNPVRGVTYALVIGGVLLSGYLSARRAGITASDPDRSA